MCTQADCDSSSLPACQACDAWRLDGSAYARFMLLRASIPPDHYHTMQQQPHCSMTPAAGGLCRLCTPAVAPPLLPQRPASCPTASAAGAHAKLAPPAWLSARPASSHPIVLWLQLTQPCTLPAACAAPHQLPHRLHQQVWPCAAFCLGAALYCCPGAAAAAAGQAFGIESAGPACPEGCVLVGRLKRVWSQLQRQSATCNNIIRCTTSANLNQLCLCRKCSHERSSPCRSVLAATWLVSLAGYECCEAQHSMLCGCGLVLFVNVHTCST